MSSEVEKRSRPDEVHRCEVDDRCPVPGADDGGVNFSNAAQHPRFDFGELALKVTVRVSRRRPERVPVSLHPVAFRWPQPIDDLARSWVQNRESLALVGEVLLVALRNEMVLNRFATWLGTTSGSRRGGVHPFSIQVMRALQSTNTVNIASRAGASQPANLRRRRPEIACLQAGGLGHSNAVIRGRAFGDSRAGSNGLPRSDGVASSVEIDCARCPADGAGVQSRSGGSMPRSLKMVRALSTMSTRWRDHWS